MQTPTTDQFKRLMKEVCWSCQLCVKERRFSQVSKQNMMTLVGNSSAKKHLNKNLRVKCCVDAAAAAAAAGDCRHDCDDPCHQKDIHLESVFSSNSNVNSNNVDKEIEDDFVIVDGDGLILDEDLSLKNLTTTTTAATAAAAAAAATCTASTATTFAEEHQSEPNERASSAFEEMSSTSSPARNGKQHTSNDDSIVSGQVAITGHSRSVDEVAEGEVENDYQEDVFFDHHAGYSLAGTQLMKNNVKPHREYEDDDDDCLNHVYHILACHPKFYECFTSCHNHILYGYGPLPHQHRHYLAIMAASRHTCTYLVSMLKNEYLTLGGCPDWLESAENVPKKLRSLNELNALMAHRPWLLNYKHVQEIVTASDEKWMMSELGQAAVILAHFHSLASFVMASGIHLVPNDRGSTNAQSCGGASSSGSEETDSVSLSSDIEVDSIVERMKKLQETSVTMVTCNKSSSSAAAAATESTVKKKISPEVLLEHYEDIECQSCLLPFSKNKSNQKKQQQQNFFQNFCENIDYQYEDVVHKCSPDSSNNIFQIRDFSWPDHGFCLSDRLYPQIGQLLEDRFSVAQHLTYNNLGYQQERVDTSTFRQAVWNFVQSLYHIRHDGYDYAVIPLLLDKKTRTFIKTVACRPQNVTKKLFESFGKELRLSEKIHMNVIVMEARVQAEILYSLRTLSQYMTKS